MAPTKTTAAPQPSARSHDPNRPAGSFPVFREGDHVERTPDGGIRLKPGPRAFTVTAKAHIPHRRIYAGAVVTIDPDAPPKDGDLVLAMVEREGQQPYPLLANYHVTANGEPYLVESGALPFRIIGRAVWVAEQVYDPNEPMACNISAIHGAPPELEIPEPDQALEAEGARS